jgi:hypothetical protein
VKRSRASSLMRGGVAHGDRDGLIPCTAKRQGAPSPRVKHSPLMLPLRTSPVQRRPDSTPGRVWAHARASGIAVRLGVSRRRGAVVPCESHLGSSKSWSIRVPLSRLPVILVTIFPTSEMISPLGNVLPYNASLRYQRSIPGTWWELSAGQDAHADHSR